MPGRLEPEPVPRRDFLGLAGLWTAGIAVFGSMIGMARLPKPRVLPEVSSRFRVGRPADFRPGTAKVMADRNVRIVATGEGIAAMSLVCSHLGCIVNVTPEGFSCPCHGSKFDSDGKVVGGPAPSRLPWLAVSQAPDGTIVVDKDVTVPVGQFFSV